MLLHCFVWTLSRLEQELFSCEKLLCRSVVLPLIAIMIDAIKGNYYHDNQTYDCSQHVAWDRVSATGGIVMFATTGTNAEPMTAVVLTRKKALFASPALVSYQPRN